MPNRAAIPLAALALLALGCNSPSTPASPDPAGPSAALATPTASASPATAPRASATVSPEEGAAALARADKCLADVACTDDADALYRRADDAGAKGVSCFRFYHGIGIGKDLPRARACFERQVGAVKGCGGSSPDLDRLYLAMMLVDAQGGPAEPARVEGLFTECFKDASVQGILEEIPRRAQPDPDRKPLDFCDQIGGTTFSIGQCHVVERERVAADRLRVDRLLLPKLDADGKKLAIAARDAWSAFANKEAELYSDKYRNGSLHSNVWASHENALQKERADAMAHFFDYKPTAGADPVKAEKDLEAPYREACKDDAERKKLCAASRKAWTAYRDAEIALYKRVHGALGEKEVTSDIRATLTRSYQADLEDVVKP